MQRVPGVRLVAAVTAENDFFLGCSCSCAETIIFVSCAFEEDEHFPTQKAGLSLASLRRAIVW